MIKRFFLRTFCGIFLGFSIFAPGISGSVVAIAMGVYQDIIRIASNPFKEFKKNVLFLLPIIVGALVSAVAFVLGFNELIGSHERAIYLLFVGLIAGNLPLISNEIKQHGFKMKYLISGIASFAVAVFIVIVSMDTYYCVCVGECLRAAYDGMPSAWLFGVGGLVAGLTALIPGMSVATILVVVGVYTPLIVATENMFSNSSYLLPFGLFCAGCIAGLVLASRVIKKVFDKFPGAAHTGVFGFMLGSLVGMTVLALRTPDPYGNFNWWIGFAMLLVGLAISGMFMVMSKRMSQGANDGA